MREREWERGKTLRKIENECFVTSTVFRAFCTLSIRKNALLHKISENSIRNRKTSELSHKKMENDINGDQLRAWLKIVS